MKKIIFIFIAIIFLIGMYGYFIDTKGFKIIERQVGITELKDNFDGFKIVQFSDLLIGSTKSTKDLEDIVKAINDNKPDIIVFTGDLFSDNYNPSKDEITEIKKYFNKLECTLYKYAVMGDNDLEKIDVFQEIMIDTNFKILDNESTYLFYKGNDPIKITGITNTDDIPKALEINDNITPTLNLVLTHYPDYIQNLNSYDIDLILAGHSLLGQIRIPFSSGLLKKDNASKYLDYYYEENNTKMYVSGGLGTEKIKFRLFNKPEINVYRLKSIEPEESN